MHLTAERGGGGQDGHNIPALLPCSPPLARSCLAAVFSDLQGPQDWIETMAGALENRALELLEHGEPSYQDACDLAQLLLAVCDGPVAFGAYVRVKAGIRVNTHAYPETTRFFAKFLADEFPGDSFLTLQIQLNRYREPHRDHQNSSLPSLICNLSPTSPGGTWVEDPEGSLPLARVLRWQNSSGQGHHRAALPLEC